MPIYSHLHGDEDHQHPYPPHHHHHHPHDPHIISPLGIGPRGKDGEKGEKGDPFTFDDFTSEQLAQLRTGVSTVYYRKSEDYITTIGDNTSVVAIPFDGYTEHDMLLVNVEGLDLIEGQDYSIDGDHITLLIEPIVHSGTRVNFTMLKAVGVTASDLDDFWGDLTEASADARGLMSASDKAKLDSISGDADKVELAQVSAYPGYGRIKVTEKDGTMYAMNVPSLDINGRIKADNLPEGFQTTEWSYFFQLTNDFGRWRAKNGIVFIEVSISRDANLSANVSRTLGSIPSGYRPSQEIMTAATTDSVGVNATLLVNPAGAIVAKAADVTGKFYASLSYPI